MSLNLEPINELRRKIQSVLKGKNMSDWKELGIQPAVSEKTIRAYKLIADLYDLHNGGAGGCGHIVFDDWNVGDSSIDFCLAGCDSEETIRDLAQRFAKCRGRHCFISAA